MQKFAYSTFGLLSADPDRYLAEVIDYERATDHGEERNPKVNFEGKCEIVNLAVCLSTFSGFRYGVDKCLSGLLVKI